MWQYEKKLQFPIKIKHANPKLAQLIISQYGGPNGELGASLRYLSQRFAMTDNVCKGILTDIGTEELAHLEMVSTLVHQLTKNATTKEIENSPFAQYYIDHGKGVYPVAASGQTFDALCFASSGDPIADLVEDLAAEQKARATYDNILRLSDDPDVNNVIKYLREREVVHFQRFGEANREDCSKIPKARKAHKFSTFGKSLSIRTFAGHRHKPPYLLLYLKMKIIHEIGQAAFSYN